jgi:hypothetical protein
MNDQDRDACFRRDGLKRLDGFVVRGVIIVVSAYPFTMNLIGGKTSSLSALAVLIIGAFRDWLCSGPLPKGRPAPPHHREQMVWSSFRRPLQLQFIIEIISGVRRDDNDCASRAMPLAPARLDGLCTCAFGVVFLKNMQAIDAGHNREIGNASGSHGGPNRAKPHLTAGKARFDAPRRCKGPAQRLHQGRS